MFDIVKQLMDFSKPTVVESCWVVNSVGNFATKEFRLFPTDNFFRLNVLKNKGFLKLPVFREPLLPSEDVKDP